MCGERLIKRRWVLVGDEHTAQPANGRASCTRARFLRLWFVGVTTKPGGGPQAAGATIGRNTPGFTA